MQHTFTLSADVRAGVTIPICIIIVLSSLLRRSIGILLANGSKNVSLEDTTRQQTLRRARLLRARGSFLPLESFAARRAAFTKPETGLLRQVTAPVNPLEMLAANQDPSAMVSMMKTQVLNLALSAGVGYLVSSLFSGFLVAKAPFLLPYKFKSILQRGIDVPNLEVTYVSSLSWYFFVLISSSNILMLLLHWLERGSDTTEHDASMHLAGIMPGAAAMMGPASTQQGLPASLGGGADIAGQYAAEREALDVMVHRLPMDAITDGVVAKLRIKAGAA